MKNLTASVRIFLLLFLICPGGGCPAPEDTSEAKQVSPAVGCSVCPPNTVCQSIEGEDTVVLCIPGGNNSDDDTSDGLIEKPDAVTDISAADAAPPGACMDLSCECRHAEGCFTGLCLPQQFGGVCTIPCKTQCPDGFQCAQILLHGETQKVCVPHDSRF
ncbi:MAG: hypothetical protein HUU55_00905 [Myxococcales bacterium]|nr:hypothetical protein [Myxococcales bacterium]